MAADMQEKQHKAIDKMYVLLKQQHAAEAQAKLEAASVDNAQVQRLLVTAEELSQLNEHMRESLDAAARVEQDLRHSLAQNRALLEASRAEASELRGQLENARQEMGVLIASSAEADQLASQRLIAAKTAHMESDAKKDARIEKLGASLEEIGNEVKETKAHAAEIEKMLQEQGSAVEDMIAMNLQEEQEKRRADDVNAQLSLKVEQTVQRAQDLSSSLDDARSEITRLHEEAKAAKAEAERELSAAQSKIEMLGSALKGTEQDKAQALAAISNMYEHTDQQLKALAGAGAASKADAGSLARIATLQAELESSMMERSECLQQLQHLQKSEREAAAEALKHRQNLEMLVAEKKSLGDRVAELEADNAKLSAENVQLVGHSNLKQRINIFNNVKDENNALKKEKAEAERLVSQQKKVIERLQVHLGAAKENACLFAKIDQEERLQAALKESESETRLLRKHLLTLLHHAKSCVGSTSLAESLKVAAHCSEQEVSKEILCDNNKLNKQRDWDIDVQETERIIDALTMRLQQKEREVSGANLKIHLLEQSARILRPSSEIPD